MGNNFFALSVSDSSTPPQTNGNNYSIDVVDPIGRNDTIATATPIYDGAFTASISPYIDPPDNAPLAADNDYYKLVAVSGSTVHIETQAERWQPGNPLDTVIEVVDGNGTRQSTCRLPGSTGATFAAACIDDDIGGSPYTVDSALDFKVPGTPSTATTFYVHVIDWRGEPAPTCSTRCRSLATSSRGYLDNIAVARFARASVSTAAVFQYGVGIVNWSLAGGNLPPGIGLASNGLISGTATSNGTYSFTVKAADGSSPPQTVTAQESIQIFGPVKISSAATWPDACVNKPYSFAVLNRAAWRPSTGASPPETGYPSALTTPRVSLVGRPTSREPS